MTSHAQLRFTETGGGTDTVGFQAPASVAAPLTWTLPAADGSANQCLSTNGSGTLSWQTVSGSGAAAAIVSGWPDAIRCLGGSGAEAILYHSWTSTAGVHQYVASWGATTFNIDYTSAGAYSTHQNMALYDCVSSAYSMATLESMGRTFMLAGGGGNIWTQGSGTAYVTGTQVGVGTSAPESLMDVRGRLSLGNANTNTDNANAQLLVKSSGNPHIILEKVMQNVGGIAADSNNLVFAAETGGFTFRTGVNYLGDYTTTGTERVRISSTGNLGIGTTSPAAKLDVAGEVKFGNTSSTCNGTNEGQQRYNSTSKVMEYCNGTAWVGFGTPVFKSQVFTASGTFTTPTGTTSATQFKFTVVGGGGGGSGSGSGIFGTGGGGGASAIYYGTGVAAGTNVSVTVGSAGTAGAGGGNGGDGGLSSIVFNSTTVTANGGGGGNYNAAEDAVATASNGTVNISGGRGSYAFGMGGSSLMGVGGPVGVNNAAGTAGSGYGAGGGGGSTGIGHSGGAGAPGIVLVEWVQ